MNVKKLVGKIKLSKVMDVIVDDEILVDLSDEELEEIRRRDIGWESFEDETSDENEFNN